MRRVPIAIFSWKRFPRKGIPPLSVPLSSRLRSIQFPDGVTFHNLVHLPGPRFCMVLMKGDRGKPSCVCGCPEVHSLSPRLVKKHKSGGKGQNLPHVLALEQLWDRLVEETNGLILSANKARSRIFCARLDATNDLTIGVQRGKLLPRKRPLAQHSACRAQM